MRDWLHLENVIQSDDLFETPVSIEIPVRIDFGEPPICPDCNKPMAQDGTTSLRVQDAPIWDKPVTLVARRQRYRCRKHALTVRADSPSIVFSRESRTKRLMRVIENRGVSHPATETAKHVGISPDVVRSVLHDLDKRIKAAPSHWRSPSLLAIDNIHCGRQPHQRNYQVLFDQGSGHAIGFVESETVDAVLKEIQRLKLDAAGVRVFSSDLSETNLALAKVFKSAIHVADKFHVFQHCNLGIKAVINSVARRLSEKGNPQAAERLRSVRRQAIGMLMPVAGPQGEFQFEPLPVELSRYEPVAIAYRAREHLWRMYGETDRAAGRAHLLAFYAECEKDPVSANMKGALRYVRDHEKQVLAWFDALDLVGMENWSPTTNSLERRNADIQKIWKSGRGYGRDFTLFRLRVLYNRFRFGVHIIECAKCGKFEGPLPADQVLARSQEPVGPKICSDCQLEHG